MIPYSVEQMLAKVPAGLAEGKMGDYSLTEKDMRVLLRLCQMRRPRHVLEIGVNAGHTAAFLLDNCETIERYVGVDLVPELFPERGIVPKEAGHLAAKDPRYSSILTNETIEDLRAKLQAAGHGWFDCLIVDANHTFNGTKRDTEGVWDLLISGGLACWHDYNVASRQAPQQGIFGVKAYLDGTGRAIMVPDEEDRDPWKCCSLAWELKV